MEVALRDKEFLRDLTLSFYEVPDSKYFLSKVAYLSEVVKERFPEVEICYFKWDERVIISVPDDFKQTEELESYLKELFYDEERYREWMVDRLRREICREALKIKKNTPYSEVLKATGKIAEYNSLIDRLRKVRTEK